MDEPHVVDARALLAEQLWADPDTRPDMERIIKKKFPKAVIPTYDVRQQTDSQVGEIKKYVDELKREMQVDRDRRDLERARQGIMEDPELRIRPDEIEAVEALMVDPTLGPIGTHAAAARLYRSQQQHVATPRPYQMQAEVPGLRGAGGEDYTGIIEDPDGWARKQTDKILADFAAGRGEHWR